LQALRNASDALRIRKRESLTPMARRSAGVVLYRWTGEAGGLEVLLVHPGGPFWAKKDAGAWSIPKGEVEAGEDERAAALRELEEETGAAYRDAAADLLSLGEVRQRSGKVVVAWALEGDLDAAAIRCAVAIAVPEGASIFWSWCSSMISTLSK